MKKSQINLYIELDEKNIPSKIEWEAEDSDESGIKSCNAMMLSLWDKTENVTMGIDLWTKDMLIEDMNYHFFQSFLKMADTYGRATNNFDVSEMIRAFAEDFRKKATNKQ